MDLKMQKRTMSELPGAEIQSALIQPPNPTTLRQDTSSSMVLTADHDFISQSSRYRYQRLKEVAEKEGGFNIPLTSLFVGISATLSKSGETTIAIAVHDSVYLHDFLIKKLPLGNASSNSEDFVAELIVQELTKYEQNNFSKFIGAGVPYNLTDMSPKLYSRLWSELDIVPISMKTVHNGGKTNLDVQSFWDAKSVEEQADSMARKCIMYFGPYQYPLLQVGYRGIVEVDAGFRAHLCTLDNYQGTCGEQSWRAVLKYASRLKQSRTQIAFFSSTPQGGGVALMRHALVRFARVIGVDVRWYVPKPRPGVFRITKTVHNILQGVAEPSVWITSKEKQILDSWIKDNAERYWLPEGGPLSHPAKGGADIIVIDDPQMPGLIPLIKAITPNRPVLYRSHIQIRSDLVDIAGTPQEDIWQFLWKNIQFADMFIAHPIASFVPKTVPRSKVAYLPATTDWLDGLNKTMSRWDMDYYVNLYNSQCHAMKMSELKYPTSKYFIQIARFDPSKGILDLVKSYVEFRRLLKESRGDDDAPQLLIVGNASIDDPDGTIIYDETMKYLDTHCASLLSSISVMRLAPNDQILNTLITNAHTVLQLSTREGFEVKVSEALHKGRPVIASQAGGIPLQVQHGKNGFLVQPGDYKAVAASLMAMWSDEELYERLSKYAGMSVSDEVGTVGNALGWFYLADVWANRGGVVPNGNWVNDLAREDASEPYNQGENRLPRRTTQGA